MGKINGCLKCLFIFFNVLFVILGILVVVAAVKVQQFADALSVLGLPSGWTAWLWIFAIGMLAVSVFGIVAACIEKEIVLKVFAGIMILGVLIMLIIGIIIAAKRNQMKSYFMGEAESEAYMSDEGFRDKLKTWQVEYKCCGVASYKDWGKEIPDSCECRGISSECMVRPADTTSGPASIYKQSCGTFAWDLFDWLFKIPMGVFFTLASTALLGLLVSLLMIRMVRRHDGGSGGQNIAMKGSGY